MSYVVTRSALPAFDNCPNTYTITWTVTDSCGRAIDCTTDYTIDNAGPVIDVCPADATVTCWEDLVATVTNEIGAMSDPQSGMVSVSCDMDYSVEVRLPTANSCPGVYTVEYVIADSCGRRDSCLVDYSIDNSLSMDCTSLGATDVACWDDVLAAISADSMLIADPLGGIVSISCDISYTIEVRLPTANSCPGIYTVEYVIADSCGRRDSCLVDYSIDNSLSMDCSSLGANDVLCWDDVLAAISADSMLIADPLGGIVSISCDISYTIEVRLPTANSCPGIYTVEYVIADSCGRRDSCLVDYSIDNSLSMDCSSLGANDVLCWDDVLAAVSIDSGAVADPSGGIVSISCGIGYTVEVRLPTANSCPGVYTVEYVVADSCGRRDSCLVDYSIDNSLSMDCSSLGADDVLCWDDVLAAVSADSGSIADPSGGIVSISCDIGYTVEVRIPDANSCPGIYTVEYVIVDSCGRRDSCEVDYSIDNSLSMDCSTLGSLVSTCWDDLLDQVSLDSFLIAEPASGVVMAPCNIGYAVEVRLPVENSCPGTYTVEYVVEDSCGRRDSCLVDYVIDNGMSLDCSTLGANNSMCWSDLLTSVAGDSALIADPVGGIVTISCNIEYTVEVRLPTATSCPGIYTVEYIVEDSCGRRDSCLVDYIIDNNPPSIVCPNDTVVDCGTDIDTTFMGSASATASCDISFSINYRDSIVPGLCPSEFTVARIWSVSDSCGRIQSCIQMIVVQDTMAPSIICPADLLIDCEGSTDTSATGVATATDNCGAIPTITYRDSIETTACAGNYTIYRIWSAEDECLNVSECIQTITVQDTSLPMITCPVDVLIDCDGSTDTTATGVATAIDNCGPPPVITYRDSVVTTACAGNYSIYRIWMASDECLNTSQCIQTITVQDTSLPVITCPIDLTIDCDGPTDTTATGVATAVDNCGPPPTLSYRDSIESSTCGGNLTIYRIWSAEDECMNIAECIQTITVQDTSLPVISCPPDSTVACDAATDTSSLGIATAVDNCGPAPTIIFADSTVQGNCGNNYEIYRIWTATDECGNASSCIQLITVEDLSFPIINNVPNDTIVPCGGVPPAPAIGLEISGTDNCGTATITFTEDSLPGICENEYILQRVWTGIDDCLNETRDTQLITVQGCAPQATITIDPNPTCLFEDVTLDAVIVGNYPNPIYQWQHFQGGVWSNIPGATTVPFILNGVTLTESGFYRLIVADDPANITNVACNVRSDSLELIVNLPDTTILDQQICDGQTFDFNGAMLTTMGTYVDSSFTTIDGCDSIIILNLEVLDILFTELTDSLCAGETYPFAGIDRDSSGVYTDTLPSSIGCDSIITLTLTVFPTYSIDINDTICEGETYNFFNRSLDSTGTYVDTIPTINGCDSVINLELVVNPTVYHEYDTTICDDVTYSFGTEILDSTGTYVDTLASATGCDSVVTLNLTVHPTYDIYNGR